MSDKIKQVAQRLKTLREIVEITTEEISSIIGISEEDYLIYESGATDIPVSILFEAANVLHVDLSTILTGSEPKLRRYSLVKNGEGLKVERSKQYQYRSLAYKMSDKKAEPFLVTVAPSPAQEPIHLNTHPGQEMDYILEGQILIQIGSTEMILNPGDTLYYDSNYPHGMKALGNAPAKFLAVIL